MLSDQHKNNSFRKIASGIFFKKNVDDLFLDLHQKESQQKFDEIAEEVWNDADDAGLPSSLNPEYIAEAKDILFRANRPKRMKVLMWKAISAAACLIAVVLGGMHYFSLQSDKIIQTSLIETFADYLKNEAVNSKDVQLILSGKQVLSVTGNDADIQYSDSGALKINQKLVEKKVELSDVQIAYDQIVVPVGKRTSLTLEDGTKISINSGSRVIVPNHFEKKRREIYVDGEVFLDVFHDESRPFIVKTKKLDIQVLGTTFNVMDYESDDESSVVLVSGSVKVRSENDQNANLVPNHKFSYTKAGVAHVESVDVTDYVSWKDGYYQFNRENLGSILTRLSRYYGIPIEYNSEVAKLTCSGRLDLKENLSRVLEGLSSTVPIKCKYENEMFYCMSNKLK